MADLLSALTALFTSPTDPHEQQPFRVALGNFAAAIDSHGKRDELIERGRRLEELSPVPGTSAYATSPAGKIGTWHFRESEKARKKAAARLEKPRTKAERETRKAAKQLAREDADWERASGFGLPQLVQIEDPESDVAQSFDAELVRRKCPARLLGCWREHVRTICKLHPFGSSLIAGFLPNVPPEFADVRCKFADSPGAIELAFQQRARCFVLAAARSIAETCGVDSGLIAKACSPPMPAVTDEAQPLLLVDLAGMTLTLRGIQYDVRSKAALRWVDVLARHPGEWISATELKALDGELDGVRPDRLKKFLPSEVRIESNRKKGSRLVT